MTISFPAAFVALENLQREMERLWLEATRNDNLNPATKFAVFSNDNEQAGRFERASELIAEALRLINSPAYNQAGPKTERQEMKHYLAIYPDKSIRNFWASSYDAAWKFAEQYGPPENVERTQLPIYSEGGLW